MVTKIGPLQYFIRALLLLFLAFPVACGGKNNTGFDNDINTDASAAADGSNGNSGSGARGTGKCADKSVITARATPWVLFVIDRSSTMKQSYPGSSSRWQAIYDTLMDPTSGIIARLEKSVYFGIMLYDGLGNCPRLETVNPALNNYNAIKAVYEPARPGQYTPTALALNAAYQLVPNQQQILDRPELSRQYVVLCTDGEPNGCPSSDSTGEGALATDFEGPIKEVTTAAGNGIKTYVVSVANSGQEYQQFLDQVAQIGNTGSGAFSPTTKDELVQQFTNIIGSAIGCNLQLNGRVTVGKECTGAVLLNSEPLKCNDANGWKLVDESHIELLGKACQKFMNNPTAIVDASFPCDYVTIY
jgi:hypothetical protein